jgi:hypothetical protein
LRGNWLRFGLFEKAVKGSFPKLGGEAIEIAVEGAFPFEEAGEDHGAVAILLEDAGFEADDLGGGEGFGKAVVFAELFDAVGEPGAFEGAGAVAAEVGEGKVQDETGIFFAGGAPAIRVEIEETLEAFLFGGGERLEGGEESVGLGVSGGAGLTLVGAGAGGKSRVGAIGFDLRRRSHTNLLAGSDQGWGGPPPSFIVRGRRKHFRSLISYVLRNAAHIYLILL